MRHKIVLLLLAALFMLPVSMQAQTPYQKRVNQIKLKYYKLFAQGSGDRRFDYFGYSDPEVASQGLSLALIEYAARHGTAAAKRLESQMNAELRAATKLKGNADKIYEWYSTDLGQVYKKVKDGFAKWNEKGEFEKADAAERRLRTQSVNAFDSICHEAVRDVYNDKKSKCKYQMLNYDSEKERFTAMLSFDDKGVVMGYVDVPIADAKEFKSDMKDDYRVTVETYWTSNNKIYPDSLYYSYEGDDRAYPLYDVKHCKVADKLTLDADCKPLTISFDKLGIDNPYLKGHVYTSGLSEKKKNTL